MHFANTLDQSSLIILILLLINQDVFTQYSPTSLLSTLSASVVKRTPCSIRLKVLSLRYELV